MRKLFLITSLNILALCLGMNIYAASVGVIVSGDECESSGFIASTEQVAAMQVSIIEKISSLAKEISDTLREQTAALQGAESGMTQMQSKAANARMKSELVAQQKIDNVNRFIYSLPPDAQCCAPDASYYFQRAMENIQEANALFAGKERNFGQGITHNAQLKDFEFAKAALNVEKNGPTFGINMFTKDQFKAWNDLIHVMFSDLQGKRPDNFDPKNAADARYLIAEARAREARVILTEPWRMYGLNRSAFVPFKEILKWAPDVNPPMFYETGNEGILGEYLDFFKQDKTFVPTGRPATKNDDISFEALCEIVGKRFTAASYLKDIDKGDAANATKAQLRLMGYEYLVLNDVRKSLQLNNLLLSMQLIKQYENWNRDAEQAIN